MTPVRRLALVALAGCWTLLTAASERMPLEDAVLAQINFARQYPQEYADQLRDYRRYFVGTTLYLPGNEGGMITREGTAAVDEAIAFLERQAPLPPVGRGALLALAAQDHVDAQGPIGGRGHVSPDGLSPGERVRRRGGDIYVGEDISYGYRDAGAIVRQLIVDDGVRDRGHRALLFNGEVRYAGIGCGAHQRYGHMCVVDMSRTSTGRTVSAELAGLGPAYLASASAR